MRWALRRLRLALHLHMHQDASGAAVAARDRDQLVHVAPAGLGIAHDALQLLVQEAMPARPVDLGMDVREQERQEIGEIALQRLLPGAVVVAGCCGAVAVGHRRLGVRSVWALV
jgi:hypothetical protein